MSSSEQSIAGRAWVFGDDVNTDVIHPPNFFSLNPEVVSRGLFNGLAPELQSALRPGDIFVAGRNFGCGSSRETCIRSLLLNRVGAIVAIDFGRIFFRSATNNGLPCLTFENPQDSARISPGQQLEISLTTWTMRVAGDAEIALTPAGDFVRRIWNAGGLLGLLPS